MLRAFVDRLSAHDASVAVALLELVRRADGEGGMERGAWRASVRSAFPRGLQERGGEGAAAWLAADGEDAEELGRYLHDHVLSRLAEAGIARGEPAGEGWERVRLTPEVLAEMDGRREIAIAALEDAVQELLGRGDRPPARYVPEPGEAGSTLSARGLEKSFRKRRVVADVDLRGLTGRDRRACSAPTARGRPRRST